MSELGDKDKRERLHEVLIAAWESRDKLQFKRLPNSNVPVARVSVDGMLYNLYFFKTPNGWAYTDRVEGIADGSAVGDWIQEKLVEQEILG